MDNGGNNVSNKSGKELYLVSGCHFCFCLRFCVSQLHFFWGGGGIKKGALFPELKKPMKVYVLTYDLHRFTTTVPIG
jgi:hypothetical protein